VCKKEHLGLLKFLLEKGADASVRYIINWTLQILPTADRFYLKTEDKTGWTPIQLEAQMYPNKLMHELLLENLKTHHAEYFATLDLKKPRAEKEHVDPAAALLTPEERFAVLGGEVSLEAVAKRIAEGKSKSMFSHYFCRHFRILTRVCNNFRHYRVDWRWNFYLCRHPRFVVLCQQM
jgi:hypothetical protein